jgi:hypothetical protein
MRPSLRVLALACVSAVLAGCNGGGSTAPTVQAGTPFRFTAATGAFYRDYTGARRPSLDVIGADGTFVPSSQTISLVAKMAGPVLDGNTNFYVWGFDRGGATNAPFPDEPNVKFNAVVIVTASNGTVTGAINLLDGSPVQSIPVTLVAPDTISTFFAASMLPSTGAQPAQYLWNLWPRNGLGGSPAAQIAKFIPDNAMAALAQ